MADEPRPYDDWRLLAEGKFELAYRASTLGIAAQPDAIAFYMNRGAILLAMHRLEDALSDYQQASRLMPQGDAGPLHAGIVLWWLRRPAEAIQLWRGAFGAIYTDSAGGIGAPSLLMFATVRLGDDALAREARRQLRKRWKPRLTYHWPGAIAGLLLGKMDQKTFREDQTFLNPTLELRRLCRAHFWIAVLHYRDGDREGYLRHLRLATEGETDTERRVILLEDEYWLAKAELELNTEGG